MIPPVDSEISALNQSATSLQAAFPSDRWNHLLQLSLFISAALTEEQVVEAISTHVFAALGAERGVLALLSAEGQALNCVRLVGYSGEIVERYRSIPLDAPAPISEAVRERKAIFVETYADRLSRYPTTLEPRLERMGTLAALPLIVNETALGALGISWTAYRTLSTDERDFLQSIAQMCGQTIARARLYDAAQRELEARRSTQAALAAERERLKSAEDALHQSEIRIQALMDSNLLGILVADDERILEANDHFLEMLGYTREDLEAGRLRWREMTPPEYLEQDDTGIMEARIKGKGALIRKEYYRKDGSRVPIILGGALLENDEGRWLTFVLDLSAQQAAEEQMSALNERLRRGIQETHHRVKNNLQIIGAMLDMSIMDAVDALSISDAKRIATQVKTLARVHDVLTSEAKQDRFGESLSSKTVLERLMPTLETATGVSIVTHIDDVSLTIQQATALALVVNELTSNAVKHGKGEVELTFYATSDQARLQVMDDGPGFTAGYDIRTSASTGLMLVEQVARHDLRGKLELGRQPGGGAQVTVTFPL